MDYAALLKKYKEAAKKANNEKIQAQAALDQLEKRKAAVIQKCKAKNINIDEIDDSISTLIEQRDYMIDLLNQTLEKVEHE